MCVDCTARAAGVAEGTHTQRARAEMRPQNVRPRVAEPVERGRVLGLLGVGHPPGEGRHTASGEAGLGAVGHKRDKGGRVNESEAGE